MKHIAAYCFLILTLCWVTAFGIPQSSIVTGRVRLLTANGSARTDKNAGIVVWLTPLSTPAATASQARNNSGRATIIQKNKRFDKRVLAVQVGATVDFPNKDPFFHNVFSHFDGQTFDLGLYEANATKSIQFKQAGVCFLFCNIHSQMSAAIVVVDTPYFVSFDTPGEFRIPDVPPGRYQLNIWAERCAPETLKRASRPVTVQTGSTVMETIELRESPDRVVGHSNKYGKTYDTPVFSSPIYIQP